MLEPRLELIKSILIQIESFRSYPNLNLLIDKLPVSFILQWHFKIVRNSL